MEENAGKKTDGTTAAMTSTEFGRLFAAWRGRFETIACRYVRSAAVAEDLVSDSFIACWENRARIADGTSLEAYLLTVVRHKCLDWLRAQRLHLKIEQEVFRLRVVDADIRSLQSFHPEEIFSAEVAAIVRRSLESLPPLTREVFLARRFGEKSYKEIALQQGITLRRVEFELEKAVKQLRKALCDYLPVLIFLLTFNEIKS